MLLDSVKAPVNFLFHTRATSQAATYCDRIFVLSVQLSIIFGCAISRSHPHRLGIVSAFLDLTTEPKGFIYLQINIKSPSD